MKFINRKISLGATLAFGFVAAAISYSVSYGIAMNKFNSIMSYNNEKQQMYSKLSEVDTLIRQEYIGKISEHELSDGLCNGYIEGLDDANCTFFTKDEYKKYLSQKNTEDAVFWEIIDENIGYIKIKSINESSGNIFSNAIKSLQSDGVSKFVIDIRNVNKGEVSSAEKILDIILPEGDTLYTVNKKGEKEEAYKTISSGIQVPVVLLVNGETSDMAEVISMAVKGKTNIKVVGETTKGHLFKQREVQLSDGSALIFPVAYYTLGDSEPLRDKGVAPDIEVALDEGDYELLIKEQLAIQDDVQIQQAISSMENM